MEFHCSSTTHRFLKPSADGGLDVQQGHAPTSDDRPLPPDLGADLAPHLREALNHRLRRRILRTLDGHPQPQTLAKLALVYPGGGVGAISYHIRVLENCGCVSVAPGSPGETESVWRYASNVSDNRQVRSILEATANLDELDD